MEAFQQRVVDERTELTAKRTKLGEFVRTNEAFRKLSDKEQGLLLRQFTVMLNYEVILDERIALFPKDAPAAKPEEPEI